MVAGSSSDCVVLSWFFSNNLEKYYKLFGRWVGGYSYGLIYNIRILIRAEVIILEFLKIVIPALH